MFCQESEEFFFLKLYEKKLMNDKLVYFLVSLA